MLWFMATSVRFCVITFLETNLYSFCFMLCPLGRKNRSYVDQAVLFVLCTTVKVKHHRQTGRKSLHDLSMLFSLRSSISKSKRSIF